MIDFAHIGLHKSASTLLQSTIFSHHPELATVGNFSNSESARRFRQHIWTLCKTNAGELNINDWRTEFDSLTRTHLHLHDDIVFGISEERLSGHYLTGERVEFNLHALRQSFGPIRIILILRNPLTYIVSAYSEYIKAGGTLSMHNFLHYYDSNGLAVKLAYKPLVQKIGNIFGSDKLLVLPYEWLKDDQLAFFTALTDFLGISTFDVQAIATPTRRNRSPSKVTHMLLRWINSLNLRRKARLRTYLVRISYVWGIPFSPLPALSIADMKAYPHLQRILQAENYQIWSGKLMKYNYTFANK